MRKAPVALGLLFLLAHLALLPRSLGDIDAINFALGVRTFDVAAHQPHPPGYPVFIAAGKAATAGTSALGLAAPEVRGLSLISAATGALAIPILVLLFAALVKDRECATWAAGAAVASPLFWFTAQRPLSDVAGLAIALLAQAFLARVLLGGDDDRPRTQLLFLGAALSGLAVGVRSQTFTLTLPLLAAAVLLPASRVSIRTRFAAVVICLATTLSWAVPLVALTGGVDGYLAALADQAGEDFVGATMWWTDRSVRGLAYALAHTFLWPWSHPAVGAIVTGAAAAGLVRLALRRPAGSAVLLVAFAPYAAFHLLFHETVMVRYALPLVPPMALLALYAAAGAGVMTLRIAAAGVVTASFVLVLPSSIAFATSPSPGERAIVDAVAEPVGGIAMHAVMLRHERWYHDNASGRVLRARHGTEVLGLVDHWRQHPEGVVQFIADRRRSDLAMLDPRTRAVAGRYEWSFPEMPLMGGVRPQALDRFLMRPPGWMLDQGWAVTAEVAGQSVRAGARPELRPSIAWVRSRRAPVTVVLGGRHLGAAGSLPARIEATVQGRWQESWDVTPGFFVRHFDLPSGSLDAGESYLPLAVTASSVPAGSVQVSLEQFDVQPPGVPMMAYAEGWQEPEYNPRTGRAWRWMSPEGALWVRPVGRDVTLTLQAESPRVYFERAPRLRVTIDGAPLTELVPDGDVDWQITLPGDRLGAANGRIVIESSESFVPGGEAGGDRRRLALRVYSLQVN